MEDDFFIVGILVVVILSIREFCFLLEIFSLLWNDFFLVFFWLVMIKFMCLLRNDFIVVVVMFVSYWMMYDLFFDFDRWRKIFFFVIFEMS